MKHIRDIDYDESLVGALVNKHKKKYCDVKTSKEERDDIVTKIRQTVQATTEGARSASGVTLSD